MRNKINIFLEKIIILLTPICLFFFILKFFRFEVNVHHRSLMLILFINISTWILTKNSKKRNLFFKKTSSIINKLEFDIKDELIEKKYKYFSLIIFILSVAIFIFAVFYQNRISRNIGGDELHIFNTAIGKLKTGEYTQWNWINQKPFRDYDRSRPISFVLFQIFKYFGIGEFQARVLFLTSGIAFLFSIFYTIKKLFKNQLLASFITLFFATSPLIISYSTLVRGYIMLNLLFIITLYLIHESIDYKNRNIRFYLVVIIGIIQLIAYKIDAHLLSILPFLFLYYLYYSIIYYFQNWFKKNKKISISFLLFTLGMGLFLSFKFIIPYLMTYFSDYLRFDLELSTNFIELSFINLNYYLMESLLLIFTLSVIILNTKSHSLKLFSWLFIYFQFLMAVFLNEEKMGLHPRYINQIIILNFILIITLFYIAIKRTLKNNFLSSFLIVILIFAINFSLLFQPFIKYTFSPRYPSEFNFWDMYTDKPSVQTRALPNHKNNNELLNQYIDQETVILDLGLFYENYYYRNLNINPDNYYLFSGKSYYLNFNQICEATICNENYFYTFLKEHENDKIIFIWLYRKTYGVPPYVVKELFNNERYINLTPANIIDQYNYQFFLYKGTELPSEKTEPNP